MDSHYRRIPLSELDQELQGRQSKEERIDFLKWLLLKDEEAFRILPEEDSGHAYVTFDKEGYRRVLHGLANPGEHELIFEKTHIYRGVIQRQLDYWENARTDAGPFAPIEEVGTEQIISPTNTVQPPKRIPWRGTITDLVYLFMKLDQEGFLGRDYIDSSWTYLKNHFEDKHGNELKHLKQTKQNLLTKPSGAKSRKGDTIDKIVSNTKVLSEQEKSADILSNIKDPNSNKG